MNIHIFLTLKQYTVHNFITVDCVEIVTTDDETAEEKNVHH